MNWSNYECEGQMSIFDLLNGDLETTTSSCTFFSVPMEVEYEEEITSFEEILKEGLLRYGTGFVNGKARVHKILRSDKSESEKQSLVKNAFGLGGSHSSPKEGKIGMHSIDTMGGKLKIGYTDEEGVKEKELSWSQVYKYIKKWDDAGEYFDSIFLPEDFKVEKHYFCNGYMYLKIDPTSKVYELPDMKDKNLYIIYEGKCKFELVSVTKGEQLVFEATEDEETVISRIGLDYGWNVHGYGIWEVMKKKIQSKGE